MPPVTVGLWPTVDSGTACGPAACASSARPMHWPELWPVHGMDPPPPGRFTAGRLGLPGMLLNMGPELGTVCGTQMPVKLSSSSPAGHWASGTEALGVAKTAIAGAAATAIANPPARIKRRAESSRVAIVTLSVVINQIVEGILWKLKEVCRRSTSSLGIRRSSLRNGAGYGLELMVERGIGCGPAAAAFSARPMHAPESAPVQGTPSISGTSG